MISASTSVAKTPFIVPSVQPSVKGRIFEQVLKVSSRILTPLGIALAGVGYKIAFSSNTFPVRLGGLIITFIGIGSLYASSEQSLIAKELDTISFYEQNGNYSKALQLARHACEYYRQKGMVTQTTQFAKEVSCLEEAHLKFGFSRRLFNDKFALRPRLKHLLCAVGMEGVNSSLSIGKINEWAQKNLLRNGERWEAQSTKYEDLKPIILPILKELGFVDEATPNFKEYQGAIVHGALLPRVRLRLQYLIDQWKQGIRFKDVYFLSGERPLEPQHENTTSFTNDGGQSFKIRKDWKMPGDAPKTECEMARLVWEQADIPEAMRKEVNVHFINAPMKNDAKSGKPLRPTTDDTVEMWLKANPNHGRYLAVSNAPYTNRQDLVMRVIAPKEYGFDTVGSEASQQEKMVIYLDELARLIFQTNQQAAKAKQG